MAEPAPARPPGPGPLAAPIPRRRALVVLGAGAVAAGTGLGLALAGCAPGSSPTAPVWVTVNVEPDGVAAGEPVLADYTARTNAGEFPGRAWLVRQPGGDLVAFVPTCTHQACGYTWKPADGWFLCGCHDGRFAPDGTVLAGPPPRPLDRYPTRVSDLGLEIRVNAPVAPSPSG